MNPLYINEKTVCLSVEEFHLKIYNPVEKKTLYLFKPRTIPYDSIIIQRNKGSISFAAIDWLMRHAVSLVILTWQGHIQAEILPEITASPELRISQYQAFLDTQERISIAKTIVETKEKRQAEFLFNISKNYPEIKIPKLQKISMPDSVDFIRNNEARYAESYFNEFEKVCLSLGQEFSRRSSHSNQHANDLINSLLNYGYAILKVYVRRAINSVGLDNSISYLHFLSKGERSSLTFDLMELWRTNIDYSVIQTLEEIRRIKGKKFGFTDEYDVEITSETAKLLLNKIRFNLSFEEIISNTRIFSNFLLGKNQKLEFNLKSISVKEIFETESVKNKILTKSYRELSMNKSTLWYQKKRLKETGSLRIYNNTKQFFVRG